MSYMDKNNILNEGFFETLKKYLIKYPALKKNKKITDKIKSMNIKVSELEKLFDKEFKRLGAKNKPIKLSKYRLKDFI